jgi:hypothetical protein
VFKFWDNFYEAMRFTFEAQAVITARWMLFASNDPSAPAEAGRMIAEKIQAIAEAHIAAERALADGRDIYQAAEEAFLPLRERVRANSERLFPTTSRNN